MRLYFWKRAAACAIAAMLMTVGISPAAAAAETTTIANPFIWADVPDDDIIRVGNTYYMVSTTMYFTPGVPIMKSNDLVSWELCNYVYDTYADGDKQNLANGEHDYAHGQWATSLRYHNGMYYVFFGSYGTGNSYIYKTDDIENGTWTRTELRGMYHDASLLFDDDGRNYLIYGGGGEIRIKEFNADMTGFKEGGADKVLFKTGLDNLAGEGSRAMKIGDYYYIFLIAWPSNSGRIELCYRSKELLGTYEGKTVLNSGLGTYGSGVAQGGIIDTPEGDWYALLFQDHGSVGRVPVLVPVTWEDGFPMMGVNGKAPTTLTVDEDYKGTSLAKDDDFSESKLPLEWQWNHNPDNAAWSLSDREGWLRLKNEHIATHLLNARNTLTMRTEGPACSSAIRLDAANMKPGDFAGLSAFQFNYGNVGVGVKDDGSKYVYMAKNGGYSSSAAVTDSKDTIVEQVPMQGDIVYLKEEFQFNTVDSNFNVSNNIDKVNFFYSFDGNTWTKIGDTLSMTYDLKLFTGYRSAIYSYPTKTTGGYADIDFFDYERAEWNAPTITEPDADGYFFHSTYEPDKGLDAWTGRGAASVECSTGGSYAGSQALFVSGRDAAWNGAAKALGSVFKPGEAFSFSADVMSPDTAASFYMKLEYTDANGDAQYSTIAEGAAPAGKWIQLSNTEYTIPADATGARIYIETAEGTMDFYVDEAIGAPAGTVIEGAGAGRTLIKGDVDGDGRITVFDLGFAKKGVKNGFTDSMMETTADVDRSGVVNGEDVELLQEFLLGRITEFPDHTPAPPEPTFEYEEALEFHEAPGYYLDPAEHQGKIVKESYNGIHGTNSLNVYLPYGYDENKQYNVFYLMHGGGENENTIFSDDVKIHNMLDHMIGNGDLEPMIVVTPTFNKCSAETVYDEVKQSIVPFVEGKYSTYAKDTTLAGLEASRMHRAYGGFSMGGGSTWNVLINDIDYFGYFMPLSGHCWGGAQAVADAIEGSKYKNSTYIFAATGTEDIAYGNLAPQIEAMKKMSTFTFTSDFSKGNLYFIAAEGKTHWWGFVRHYVYDALPYFFHEGQ